MKMTILACAAAASFTGSCPAHEFWIKPAKFTLDAGSTLDVQLFVGDGFPGEAVARNGPKIEQFAAFSDAGEVPIPGVNGKDPAGSIKLASAGVYVLAFRNSPSRLELEAAKFEEYLKEEGLDAIITKRAEAGKSGAPGRELYSRCAKSIVRVIDANAPTPTTGRFDREVGQRYELIPVIDPAGLVFGSDGYATFKVRAVFEGKPLAKMMIAARTPDDPKHVAKTTTDAEGRAELKLSKAGMWLVSSVHMVAAPANSNADWESIWASITFEVPTTATTTPETTPADAERKPKLVSSPMGHEDSVMRCGGELPRAGEFAIIDADAHAARTRELARVVVGLRESLRAAANGVARGVYGETKHRLARRSRDVPASWAETGSVVVK